MEPAIPMDIPRSKSFNDDDDLVLDPLSFADIERNKTVKDDEFSPEAGDVSGNKNFFSIVMGMKRKRVAHQRNNKGSKQDEVLKNVANCNLNVNCDASTRLHWKQAIMKSKLIEDPWANFHIAEYETEVALRYRYNALQKSWVKDEVYVKSEKKPFSRGAMRECFRLKKLSNFIQKDNWKTAANYVVKRYMDLVDRKVYFDDVRLQMDAKLWGEEYNRHNPPKKVDIFQMSVLEFCNRPKKPLYHVEHYIEGNYIKYNSNSGYVWENACRFTPQAFSHFTFERSGHELIVVDIQGVGDLYTDPQIHTCEGNDYGDGNLGTKGMALFFHSHTCNDICHSLGLSEFDLYKSELDRPATNPINKSHHTVIRGTEEICMSPSKHDRINWHQFLRKRTISTTSSNISTSPPESPNLPLGNDILPEGIEIRDMLIDGEEKEWAMTPASPDSGVGSIINSARRNRFRSSDSGTLYQESERVQFGEMVSKKSRPSCIETELFQLENSHGKFDLSVLGEIHLDLAKYHELCRFVSADDNSESYDKDAALFHLEQAAKCGILEAVVTLSKIYVQQNHDILVEVDLPEDEETYNKGVEMMVVAAEAGDRSSMMNLAKAFDTGLNLGTRLKQSWERAVYWYDRAVKMDDADESGEFDGCMNDPKYQVLARQAEMYVEGGNGLNKDPEKAGELFNEAADIAMSAMKGRLANKYFAQAEEAWAEMDDDSNE